MSGRTQHFGWSILQPNDKLSDDGYKILGTDRDSMDNVVYKALKHHHNGGTGSAVPVAPTGPTLVLTAGSGVIPGGTRVYYRTTLIDADGIEGLPSPEQYVDTPPSIAEPAAPVLTIATTGGTLVAGVHSYALSAYLTDAINETRAPHANSVTAPSGTTNKITLTLPPLPSGATGFNVYRRRPGGSGYVFLTSIDMNVPTPPTIYEDAGGDTEDCNRFPSTKDRSTSSNSVLITYPGVESGGVVPVGYTWKVYRTYTTGNYVNSLLHWVTEETTEGSGVITTTYLDLGYATFSGAPPENETTVDNPDPIEFTDAEEVTGILPMGRIAAFPVEVPFAFPGTLVVADGTFCWVCEFPAAVIVSVRAALGRGFAPAATPVIFDVNLGPADVSGIPTYTTIFTDPGDRPTIPVGQQIGDRATPDVKLLARGDVLTVDCNQAGGGATPTDADAVITVSLLAYDYPVDDTVDPATDDLSEY